MGKRLTMADQLAGKDLVIENLRAENDNIRQRLNAAERAEGEWAKLQNYAEGLEKALTDLREGLAEGREELTKVKKELDTAQSLRKHHDQRADKAEADLEQVHAVLDGIPSAPSREYEGGEWGGKLKRTAVTRLAGGLLAVSRGSL